MALLRQRWPSSGYTRRLFSVASSAHASNSDVSACPDGSRSAHQSLVTNVPNLQALQRVRGLLQQPQRRVLLLTGSSASGSATRLALERDAPAFELSGAATASSVRASSASCCCASGRERRVFGRAQLVALLLHNGLELPGASRLAATSTLQRRKAVQDLLQLFRLLEREGVTPEQYSAAAVAGGEQVPQELAETYRQYQELLLQHNATSWDGLVLDVLEMCGLQHGADEAGATTAFSRSVLREYTDVVLDDLQRMTPAMARLAGHLCGQPSVLSSASFSRVLLEGNECFQTQILERQLEVTAAATGCPRTVDRVALDVQDDGEAKRAKVRAFASQVLTQSGGVSAGIPSPVPLKCWNFNTSEAEERSIGTYLADWLASEGSGHATVLCPSHADASRVLLAFKKQGLPVQMDADQFSSIVNSSGAPIHL